MRSSGGRERPDSVQEVHEAHIGLHLDERGGQVEVLDAERHERVEDGGRRGRIKDGRGVVGGDDDWLRGAGLRGGLPARDLAAVGDVARRRHGRRRGGVLARGGGGFAHSRHGDFGFAFDLREQFPIGLREEFRLLDQFLEVPHRRGPRRVIVIVIVIVAVVPALHGLPSRALSARFSRAIMHRPSRAHIAVAVSGNISDRRAAVDVVLRVADGARPVPGVHVVLCVRDGAPAIPGIDTQRGQNRVRHRRHAALRGPRGTYWWWWRTVPVAQDPLRLVDVVVSQVAHATLIDAAGLESARGGEDAVGPPRGGDVAEFRAVDSARDELGGGVAHQPRGVDVCDGADFGSRVLPRDLDPAAGVAAQRAHEELRVQRAVAVGHFFGGCRFPDETVEVVVDRAGGVREGAEWTAGECLGHPGGVSGVWGVCGWRDLRCGFGGSSSSSEKVSIVGSR